MKIIMLNKNYISSLLKTLVKVLAQHIYVQCLWTISPEVLKHLV